MSRPLRVASQRVGAVPAAGQFVVKFTQRELELLTMLAADQLFRREFIDPKMPGHRGGVEDVQQGKALLDRLRAVLDPRSAIRRPASR